MRDLGDILRCCLPKAETRRDVVELCKRTLIDAEAAVRGHRLFIRYIQPVHFDYCHGPVDGLALSGVGPKIGVGIAFIDPTEGIDGSSLESVWAGGAVCHPDDGWSKPIGKTIALLRARRVSATTATRMAICRAPWERSAAIMHEKQLRSQTMEYPWSVLLEDQRAFPSLALPAVVDAIRYAIRYNLGGSEPFHAIATTTLQLPLQPVSAYADMSNALIDKACKLPINVPLTDEERAQKEAESRTASTGALAP